MSLLKKLLNALLFILGKIQNAWRFIKALNSALQPARVSLIIAIATPVLFLAVPQGKDVLNALGERGGLDGRTGWFFVGLGLFGLMNWYGLRFLFNCDFGVGTHESEFRLRSAGDPKALSRFHWLEDQLGWHLPRVLGTAPIAAIGCGFLRLWYQAKSSHGPATIHGWMAICCFVLAAVLYAMFFVRRKFLNERFPGIADRRRRYRTFKDISDDKPGFAGVALILIAALALGVMFTAWPVNVGLHLGSGAVLLFALGSWACYGTIAIYLGHRAHLPTLTLCALLAVGASFFNDNHAVRTLEGRGPDKPREALTAKLQAWHARVADKYPGEKDHPLFIVVTEGGGIRAAYWTALVLSTLEDRAPGTFSDHLFAISGVSGGSLGAAAFDVMLGDNSKETPETRVRRYLGEPFLAPLVGKMTFPDLWQRFLPWPWEAFDRAQALEDGWGKTMPAFKEPFSQLYEPARPLPELFLNGTEMETGRRIVTSTVSFSEDATVFVDAVDGVEKMGGKPMRLSTAVDSSTRFTYFSPAGRYPDGTHVVDGGYYENSGGSTGHDILRVVYGQDWKDVRPIVIVITNGVEEGASPTPVEPGSEVSSSNDHAAHEILAPLTTLLGTRSAHADQAKGELLADVGPDNTFTFALVRHGTAVPLGWALSPDAMDEMDFQVDPGAKPEELARCTPAEQAELAKNSEALKKLVGQLPAK